MRLSPFQTLHHKDHRLVISRTGVSAIHEPALWELLQDWAKAHDVEKTEIRAHLKSRKLDDEAALQFLEDIIGFQENKPLYFKSARIFNCQGKLFDPVIAQGFPTYTKTQIYSNYTSAHISQACLDILLISDPLCDEARSIYNSHTALHPKNGVIVGYVMDHGFLLSAPYIPEIGNPCAYCEIDKIIHYSTIRKSHHKWGKLNAFLRNENIPPPERILTQLETRQIADIVSVRINIYTNSEPSHYQDNVYLDTFTNLKNGITTEHHPTHWYLCECRSNYA